MVQSHSIPTAGGAAGGGRVTFGQPSWSAPTPARPATNPRDDRTCRAKKKKKKKSFPTFDSIVVDLTTEDVVSPTEDESTPPGTFSSAIVDVLEEDASAPQQIETPRQVVGGVEVGHKGGTGRADGHVGLLLSTAQLPLPDFAAYMAELNEVRKDTSLQSVDTNGQDGFCGHPFLKMSKGAIFRAKKAARRAKERSEVRKEQATGSMATTAANTLPDALPLAQSSQQTVPASAFGMLPPMPLLPGLSPAEAVTRATGPLSEYDPLTGLPSAWVQAVERARESARKAGLSPMRRLAPPCIAPLPRSQDLPPVSSIGGILTMYTDGSWSHDDGSGGAGVAYQVKGSWYGRAIALGHIVDQHVAELEGIRHAVRMAHSIVPQVRAKQLVILTDSETSLYVLSAKEGDGIRVPSMLQHINDAIQRDKATLGIEVRFWWVKAHAHTVGNERADRLARFGRKRTEGGEVVGRVYENVMAYELDRRLRHQKRVRTDMTPDVVVLGASSLPGADDWRHLAKLRAADEEVRSVTRLANRLEAATYKQGAF